MSNIRRVGNFENSGGRKVLDEVITDLNRAIAYFVSEERRAEVTTLGYDDKLVAAIAMLASIAENYKISIKVTDKTVRQWREICLLIFDKGNDFDPEKDTSGWKYERREIILNVFARMEAIAALYPPFPPLNWLGKDKDQ